MGFNSFSLGLQPKPRIRIGAMVDIPKSLLASVEREKRALTVLNKIKVKAKLRGFANEDPDYYQLYYETATSLVVPRAHEFTLRPDLQRSEYEIEDLRLNALKATKVASLGTDLVKLGPNDSRAYDQRPAYEALLETNPFGGKFLVLGCGKGKTVISLKAAHSRSVRTLWVTPSTALIEQTKRAFLMCLGIQPKQIAHIQGARSCKWQEFDVGIAMLHTLARREFPQEFWDHWGLIIFDEGDALGAKHFSTIAPRFIGERWVLTATPKRADGMETLFEKHVGPVCYEDLSYDVRPEVYFVSTKAEANCLVRVGWDFQRKEKRVNFACTAKELLIHDGRLTQLFDLVRRAVDKQRTCLVVGDSVEGLVYAAAKARDALPSMKHGLVIGRVPVKERDKIVYENDVVWATTQLAFRGLDRPAFDTLIIATLAAVNRPRWVQAGGRLLRVAANKAAPIIVVLTDVLVGPLVVQAAKLALIFRREGWKSHNDGNLIQTYRTLQKSWRDATKDDSDE